MAMISCKLVFLTKGVDHETLKIKFKKKFLS